MFNRIMSREEREFLSPDALTLIYKHINSQYCSPDIIEKVLMQAVIIARLNQTLVDADTISFLMEKISEYEGAPVFDPLESDSDRAHRYC